MPWQLADPGARFTFVVGKGGVGKSTTAALLALGWATPRRRVHLLSTDPAHSIGDVFGLTLTPGRVTPACVPGLALEEPDADARAGAWLERIRAPLTELLERGSYLDAQDIARFTSLRIPGVDELMAALRLVELSDAPADHVVVDTAPTGHTLRLLAADTLLEGWSAALEALAAKADAVANALVGGALRSAGAALREELARELVRFRTQVLAPADFVVVTRAEAAVRTETDRLIAALMERGLRVRAELLVGAGAADPAAVRLPWWSPPPRGCTGLAAAVRALAGDADVAFGPAAQPPAATRETADGAAWLAERGERLLMFAGKGGVGKSTCAAAAALVLGQSRRVLLLSADPAGSLGDVLGVPVGDAPVAVAPGVRAAQIDAAAALERWREQLESAFEPLLSALGLGGEAALDRRVFETLWELAPPGMDELVALAELLDAVAEEEMVVLDTAPTGHFLRLLALPEVALEWTRALMRLLLKYGVTAELDAVTKDVIAFARQLRELQARLADAGWTGTVVVTLAEPVVEAETARLVTALDRTGVPLTAILSNRHQADAAPRAPRAVPVLRAPLIDPPPRAPAGLLGFAAQWELE